jgi:hypothetical protein
VRVSDTPVSEIPDDQPNRERSLVMGRGETWLCVLAANLLLCMVSDMKQLALKLSQEMLLCLLKRSRHRRTLGV